MEVEKVKSAIEQIAAGISSLAEALDEVEEKDIISPSKLKEGKRGRKAKSEEIEEDLEIEEDTEAEEETDEDDSEEETEEDTDTEEDDDDSEEEDSDEEESEDEDEKVNKLELKTLKAALNKYADPKKNKGGSKAKAVKLLRKFAPTSAEVKRKDFAKLLKLLKV